MYKDINDKSVYEEWRMKNCSAVPENWNKGQFWVDVHDKCLQFYEGRVCSGRSLQLQPTPVSTIFKWNFPDFIIRSVSVCQSMPPSTFPNQSTGRPIGGPGSGSNAINSGNGNGNWQQGGGGLTPSLPGSSVQDGNNLKRLP